MTGVTTLLDQSWAERDVFIAIVRIMSFVADVVEIIIIIGLQHTSRDQLRWRVGISMSCRFFSLFDFLVIMMSTVITNTILRQAADLLIFVLSASPN